jgi:hypothetical protein
MGLWPAFSIGKKLRQTKFFAGLKHRDLLNYVGDINLGIHDFAQFPSVVRLRNSRTWSYTGPDALIDPKYFPSGHCTARLTFSIETDQQAHRLQRVRLRPDCREGLTSAQTIQ